VTSDVLMTANIKITVFWVVILCTTVLEKFWLGQWIPL